MLLGSAQACSFSWRSFLAPNLAASGAAAAAGEWVGAPASPLRGLRCLFAGGHLQHHLIVVAQIDRREMRILLTPLGDMRLEALVAIKEMIFAKVRQNVGALLGHQHARVFRIGEVNLRDLLGVVLAVGVQLGHHAQVYVHARLARVGRIAGIDARQDRKRVMMLGHGCRRHVEQHAIGVDESDLLAVPRKRNWLPLHDRDANLVGQHAHHRGVLDPRNLLKLLASRSTGTKKTLRPMSSPKTGSICERLTSVRPVA